MTHCLSAVLTCGALLVPISAYAAAPTKEECIAANDGAQDLRRAGKLHDSREKLVLCVSQSCPGPVRDDCNERLAEVDKAMPTIVVAATDHDGNDMSAVRVLEDARVLVNRLDGSAVAVDPGEHVLRFEAVGYVPVTRKIVLREAEKERHIAVTFAAASSSAGPPRGSVPKETGGDASGEDTTPSRWPAYVAFGVGGAGLVAGVAFVVAAVNQQSTLQRDCGGLTEAQCHAYVPGEQSNLTADNVAMGISFGVAALAAGLGTYLLLSAPSSSAQARPWWLAPRIALGWAGVEGGFR